MSVIEPIQSSAMTSDQVVVYTAVTAGYDVVLRPAKQTIPMRFVLFTDRGECVSGWESMPLRESFPCSVSINRYHKFMAHQIFPEFEYSIYVDGNIGLIGDLATLFEEFVASGAAIGLFLHQGRRDVEEEVSACLDLGRFDELDSQVYQAQLQHMFDQGMPRNQVLTANGVIFRWHRHPELAAAMEEWWHQFQQYTKRDQLSLPYILWNTEIPAMYWDASFRRPSPFFRRYPHRGSRLKTLQTRLRHALLS
ncbi:DUF616 domain-containing protein [Halieaceae bacterium IMCC11814]|uniref:DUF616 domain-containing protein n=2 Tax=Candidatus Marimicrobium litorale TaxID=2518991 RepID=A0ABT3TBJ8_9GAMM|nr:DUF616 domain-containing protein [Candidatus Marimicrobium litorale]